MRWAGGIRREVDAWVRDVGNGEMCQEIFLASERGVSTRFFGKSFVYGGGVNVTDVRVGVQI